MPNYSNFLNREMKFVSKNWGWESWIDNNELYCGKQLFIKREKRLSLHYHNLKTETFYIHDGQCEITVYTDVLLDSYIKDWNQFNLQKAMEWDALPFSMEKPETFQLTTGDTFKINVGMRHTVYAHQDTLIYEFSTQHFDEDSIRVLVSEP